MVRPVKASPLFVALMFAAVLASAGLARADDMAFRLVPLGDTQFCGHACVEVIEGEGEISDHTAQDFLTFAKANFAPSQARNVLFLDSPGGNVVGSLEFGRVLRRLGTAVVIARVISAEDGHPGGIAAGRCMSACVYALMGGAKRVIPRESLVGIHRMFRKETEGLGRNSETVTLYAPDAMVAALSQYSGSMGISLQLVATAERIPPETVKILTPAEIRRWRLGTTRF